MRVALVHDYLNQRGGAERVFAHIAAAYPDAPIYTSLLYPPAVDDLLDVRRVRTSFLQYIPGARGAFRALAPLYPLAFERMDLSPYDVVVSSTTSWAKGVKTRPDTVHVCYINTVSRFAFAYDDYVGGFVELHGRASARAMLARAAKPLVQRLIAWDRAAAQRPTAFIANSQNVARRVRDYYGREAHVIPCPVDVARFSLGYGGGGYALVVSRLLPYKRIEVAIAGCARARIPLRIIGVGPAEEALRAAAIGTHTTFLGAVDDQKRAAVMAKADWVILPGEEDFGLVPIEAAAAGRPTLAFGSGGALETIKAGETGEFFAELSGESLAAAILRFNPDQYDPHRLRAHAETFAPERFTQRLHEFVDAIYAARQAT